MLSGSGGAGEAVQLSGKLKGEPGKLGISCVRQTEVLCSRFPGPEGRASSGERLRSWKSSSMEM